MSEGTSSTQSIVAGNIQAHSFSAATAQAYKIQWEDAGQQSASAYTGDVVVSAYRIYQSGSYTYIDTLFTGADSGYTTPYLTTYETANTVLLLVTPKTASTGGTYSLLYDDALIPVVDLSGGTYTNGTLTGVYELYRFNAAASTSYTVSIQRSGDQAAESSYTAYDIWATVYWEDDNTVIVQQTNVYGASAMWYANPQTFNTGERSGNIIIKIWPYYSGEVGRTYGVQFTSP